MLSTHCQITSSRRQLQPHQDCPSQGAYAPKQPATRSQRICPQRGQLQVVGALSRVRKEETVDVLVEKLERSYVVYGLRFQGIDVKTMQEFRKTIPGDSLVCKNTLMRIAADKVEGFSELKQAAKGDNCWVFAEEDNIAASVKAYLAFEKKMQAKLTKDQKEAGKKLTDFSGGCMDGKYLSPEELRQLDKMSTKKELLGTIARLIKQVPTKLAVGIKQVPTKVARGIQAIADADDNKDLIAGDVCKPKVD